LDVGERVSKREKKRKRKREREKEREREREWSSSQIRLISNARCISFVYEL